eukprot:5543452-Pyramimonas_sp.AAC.1
MPPIPFSTGAGNVRRALRESFAPSWSRARSSMKLWLLGQVRPSLTLMFELYMLTETLTPPMSRRALLRKAPTRCSLRGVAVSWAAQKAPEPQPMEKCRATSLYMSPASVI